MALTLYKSAPARRSSPITGNLGIVYRVEEYVDSFTTEMAKTLQAAVDAARKEVRQKALHDPFWKDFVSLIDVKFEDGAFQFDLSGPADQVEQAIALEFGALGQPPRPFFRKLAMTEGITLGNLISQRMTEQVGRVSA